MFECCVFTLYYCVVFCLQILFFQCAFDDAVFIELALVFFAELYGHDP